MEGYEINSQVDLQRYLDYFNNKQYSEQIGFYAPDVVYRVGTLALTRPQAIADYYADFHQYVDEHVTLLDFAINGNFVAAGLETSFIPRKNYQQHGLSFVAGEPLHIVSLLFYSLAKGKIRRIRMGRYNGTPQQYQE